MHFHSYSAGRCVCLWVSGSKGTASLTGINLGRSVGGRGRVECFSQHGADTHQLSEWGLRRNWGDFCPLSRHKTLDFRCDSPKKGGPSRLNANHAMFEHWESCWEVTATLPAWIPAGTYDVEFIRNSAGNKCCLYTSLLAEKRIFGIIFHYSSTLLYKNENSLINSLLCCFWIVRGDWQRTKPILYLFC